MSPNSQTEKVATFWRGEVAPGKLDEAMAAMKEMTARGLREEPNTLIQAFHLEPPNVIWLYGLFENQAALDHHRKTTASYPEFGKHFASLFTEMGKTAEVQPISARGLDFGEGR